MRETCRAGKLGPVGLSEGLWQSWHRTGLDAGRLRQRTEGGARGGEGRPGFAEESMFVGRWAGRSGALGGHRVLRVLVASWAKLGSELTARGPGPSSATGAVGPAASRSPGARVSPRECAAGPEGLQGAGRPRPGPGGSGQGKWSVPSCSWSQRTKEAGAFSGVGGGVGWGQQSQNPQRPPGPLDGRWPGTQSRATDLRA